MPGFIVQVGAPIMCPHGGQAQVVPGNPRVLLSGMPAATMVSAYPILGCPFVIPPGPPQPCLRIQWTVPAARVLIGGSPAVLQASAGLTIGPTQAPQGVAIVAATQPRVGAM